MNLASSPIYLVSTPFLKILTRDPLLDVLERHDGSETQGYSLGSEKP